MRLVRIADQAPVPWRNGRGVTRDLGSGEGWRLSLAEIESPGPFSRFPGLYRRFALASGAARLRFASGREVELDAASAPIGFDGDDAPECTPAPGAGACRALNLMFDPRRFGGRLERRRLRANDGIDANGGSAERALAIFVQRGAAIVAGPAGTDARASDRERRAAALAAGDAAFAQAGSSAQLTALVDDTIVVLVLLEPRPAEPMRNCNGC